MRVYDHFRYTGTKQRWVAPKGVTQALFECWGAAGGMPSDLANEGKKRQVVGGTAPKNNVFYNNPNGQGQLGQSFANGAGYAQGVKTVAEGDTYYVYVGGNGGPGHSTIKLKDDGSYELSFRGGDGGYNGGGTGGQGGHTHKNLFNSTSRKVHFAQNSMPGKAKVGQLWWDTNANEVYKCTLAYSSAGSLAANWNKVTHDHEHGAGPSGGGGGGATDIRFGGDDTAHRILVAGGGGGAGGPYNKTGSGSWSLNRVPGTPAPPFGTDDASTGATGPDSTWCTSVSYLSGSWGLGGIGGGSGPKPNVSVTTDTGYATTGGPGGDATDRHEDGTAPKQANGSGGKGGGPLGGGAGGNGGSAQNGSKAQGGNGADAPGGIDDWCAGGGGGGGGYYGGGGGGYGFRVAGQNGGIHTRGGGGGGGSSYADPGFTSYYLAAAAQPPFAKGNSGTGSNGNGGFARISYRLPPEVRFKTAPLAVETGTTFDVVFDYVPAQTNGPGIDHYVIGTASDPSASFPTSTTTIMVTDHTLTEFTHTFTAPGAGVQEAFFVQVIDTDGDASDWLKQKVTGLAAASTTPVTITAPAAGSTFEDSATVDWSIGTQTPLVAYKVGLSGHPHPTALKPNPPLYAQESGWRRGGSRVNLATDPGFTGGTNWFSDANAALIENDVTHPGVSGKNGRVPWNTADDGSAEQHSLTYDNLNAGTEYRLHIGVGSNLTNDLRPVLVEVSDDSGLLASTVVDLSTTAAGTYVIVDLPFTPHAQGVFVSIVPSASGTGDGDPLVSQDFEDGTVGAWTGVNGHTLTADTAESFNGDTALKISGTNAANQGAALDVTASLPGAGDYVVQGWGWSPTGADHSPVIRIVGTGTSGPGLGQGSSISDWSFIRFPFHWDGTSTVTVQLDGDGATSFGGKWYDLVEVYTLDETEQVFGSTDSQQTTYLKDMLIEMTFEGETTYPAYFDGGHLNGLTGTVSWEGTAGASASYLTGTDVVTDTVAYSGGPLVAGKITVTTLAEGAVADGFDGSVAQVLVDVNPTPPATPTVVLTVDSAGGVMTLAVNANDGAQPADNKTVTFDIFRNGTRIATGLTPDPTTREAVYDDVPASGEAATYVVRAWSQGGGYADQSDGTVN